jgi:Flp pilus assembly protein CpaB
LAFLAFGLVFVVAGAFSSGRSGPGGPTVKVVVAARDIPLRAPLMREDLVLQDFTQSDVPPGSYSQVKDATGLIAELNITKGQVLTQNMLAKSGDVVTGIQPAYLPIPQGFVALTIPTGEQQGVAGYIQAGDYINVIATVGVQLFNPKDTVQRTVNRTVFTNLHVLRTGPASGQVQTAQTQNGQSGQQQSTQTGAGASSLTVVMTQCDAEFMNWFLNSAQLKYTLGSYKDYQPQDSKPDPTCPSATKATGVGPKMVDDRWHFTTLT